LGSRVGGDPVRRAGRGDPMKCHALAVCMVALLGCGPNSGRNTGPGGAAGPMFPTQPRHTKLYSISQAIFSRDGKWLLTATLPCDWGEESSEKVQPLQFWDVENGHKVASFGDAEGWPLAFLPDGKRFVFKPREGKLEIREARTGKVLTRFED